MHCGIDLYCVQYFTGEYYEAHIYLHSKRNFWFNMKSVLRQWITQLYSVIKYLYKSKLKVLHQGYSIFLLCSFTTWCLNVHHFYHKKLYVQFAYLFGCMIIMHNQEILLLLNKYEMYNHWSNVCKFYTEHIVQILWDYKLCLS